MKRPSSMYTARECGNRCPPVRGVDGDVESELDLSPFETVDVVLPTREFHCVGKSIVRYPCAIRSSPNPTIELEGRCGVSSSERMRIRGCGHHALSSATDHPRSRGDCFHPRCFVTALGFRSHHGGRALAQRWPRPNGRASLKPNPGDGKGAWDNSAAGRRPTASRSRSARRAADGDQKAFRAADDVDQET